MPKIVVRKSYRCQPGRRREMLTALQGIDAAAARAGYPRGRYLMVETRSPGDPDLEVEFTFESYVEMDQLERRMREHVARYLRDGGATGQELLLESSATRYLLLVEDSRPAGGAAAVGTTTAPRTAAPGPAAPTATRGAPSTPLETPVAPATPARAAAPPPEPSFDDDDDESFEDLRAEDLPEPEVPPAPELPRGVSAEQFQQGQLARARAALAGAEKAVNMPPRGGGGASQPAQTGQAPKRPPRTQE